MMFMICPTCGEKLRDKQIIYDAELENLVNEFGVTYEMISNGTLNSNADFVAKRTQIIDNLVPKHQICCRIEFLTYVQLSKLIK